jgi:hypothetical protein
VTETVKRTAIETEIETEIEKENENEIATETAIVAEETMTDQKLIATSPLPVLVPLAAIARNLSASAIAHAREAAMLGRTATSFGAQHGSLGVSKSMRCPFNIEDKEMEGHRESSKCIMVGVYGVVSLGL